MITKGLPENYIFQKDGILILLLPFKKRKHHKALRSQSAFNQKPTEGLLKYLIRHQSTATTIAVKGNSLIGHLPDTPYGNCLAIFPKAYKLHKLNIKRVPLLVIADNEMGKANFYTITNNDIQQIKLPLIKGKAFVTRFFTNNPHIVWIKPNIKIKAVIKGFYLHDRNSNKAEGLPPFSIEQFVQLTTRKN